MAALLLSGGELLTMSHRPHRSTCGASQASEAVDAPRVGWIGTVDDRIVMVSYDVAAADRFVAAHPCCEVVDCRGMVLMPGLVNTHTHVSMTLMRNMADDMELMEWLEGHIWPFEALQSEDDIRAGARLGIAEMLLGGTTSFVDMYWSEHAIADAAEGMGIRALLAESVLDGREESFERNMDLLVRRCEGSALLRPAVGPHAPYTCSPATLELAVSLAERYDAPLTIHLSESPSEGAIIGDRYGSATPLEYLMTHGVVGPRTILAHAIHLTAGDIESIAACGAAVAHNAQSNMKLASGIAPVAALFRAGALCTIATDSASSNNDLNMWEELRTAALLQRAATLDPLALGGYEVLYMATRGGAAALGYGDGDLGVLCEGALADIIAVDLRAPHMRPRHNTISALAYCATAADVQHVVVGGVLKVRGRDLVGHDLESIISDAETRALALRARLDPTL